MKRALLIAALGLAAQALALQPLHNNGAIFFHGQDRFPLRCLDEPALLDLGPADQDAALDKAAAAGFNSLSFAAPIFGEDGFCKKLGILDQDRIGALKALLAKMEARRLYAFPVLWNQQAVDAFSRIGGGPDKFFSGKIQNQWQAWLLRSLISSGGEGASSLSGCAAVGGWMLYRGSWPGPKHRGDEPSDSSGAQAFTAPLRGWLLWQLRALRQGGARQMAGAGFILKRDLGDKGGIDDPATEKPEADLPIAPLKQDETKVGDDSDLDRLPPLPGEDSAAQGSATSEALTPWDLEGVDWDSVGRALREVPVSTGLDFMELTLDTEDWYRVGEAMAGAVEQESQAPVLWRQDWRNASRYERQKHLEAPEGLAGLVGPWPENDWPDPGDSIWPPEGKSTLQTRALVFKYMEVKQEGGEPVLELHLNLPCDVTLLWGRKWPPTKRSASLDQALVHSLTLKGAKFGESVLFVARAKSKRWGRAVLRSRWVKLAVAAPLPEKGAKGGKEGQP